MKPTYEELEARCAALAADNAGLKTFGDKLSEMHNDLNGEGTGIQGRAEVACQQVALEAAMEEFDAIKTPATDDFLAEVQAQGVEMMAAEADQLMDEFGDDSYKVMVTADLQRFANAFAAQLRKGVQS